jgi:hypothetical protein
MAEAVGMAASASAEVPVIDLRLAGASPVESARLRAACQRQGCFRVTGHGVPRGLLAEMKAAVRALFDLPDDAKRRNTDVIPGSGYVAPSATNPLYEAFGLVDAAAPADVDAFCARLDAPPHVRLVGLGAAAATSSEQEPRLFLVHFHV